ncbi:MAG: ATP-binding protein [Ferrimicrobium sp.]
MESQTCSIGPRLSTENWTTGAVLIEGPKACGKTETALRVANSSVMLDIDVQAKQALTVDPSLVLEGPTPRLIDEWQESPSIWNEVRRMVDQRKTLGQFILTGSSVPNDDTNRHSGAGRFSILTMRPMTLFETGYSAGLVSLARLMEGEPPKSGLRELSLENLADLIVRGGWPRHLELTSRAAARSVRDYLDNICHVDLQRLTISPSFRTGRSSTGRGCAPSDHLQKIAAENVRVPLRSGSQGTQILHRCTAW